MNWCKLTSIKYNREIWVNLDSAPFVVRESDEETRLYFNFIDKSGEQQYLSVEESPEEILGIKVQSGVLINASEGTISSESNDKPLSFMRKIFSR
jgi:hypothetical protein